MVGSGNCGLKMPQQERMIKEEIERKPLIPLNLTSTFRGSDQDVLISSPRNESFQEPLLQVDLQQNASTSNISGTSGIEFHTRDLETKVCRICHNGNSEETLLSPCKCCGSAKYAHESCLMAWFERKRNKICELCLYEIQLVRKGFKAPVKWKIPIQSCDFITCLFMFYCLILVAFLSMVMWVASNSCTSTVCIILYFVSVVSLIYFIYCCGFIKQIVQYWTNCLDLNRKFVILSRTESKSVLLSLDTLTSEH